MNADRLCTRNVRQSFSEDLQESGTSNRDSWDSESDLSTANDETSHSSSLDGSSSCSESSGSGVKDLGASESDCEEESVCPDEEITQPKRSIFNDVNSVNGYSSERSPSEIEVNEVSTPRDPSSKIQSVPDPQSLIRSLRLGTSRSSPKRLLLLIKADGTIKSLEWPPASDNALGASERGGALTTEFWSMTTKECPCGYDRESKGPAPLSSFAVLDEASDTGSAEISSDDESDSDSDRAPTSTSRVRSSPATRKPVTALSSPSQRSFTLVSSFGGQLMGQGVFIKSTVRATGANHTGHPHASHLSWIRNFTLQGSPRASFELPLHGGKSSPKKSVTVSYTNETAITFKLISLGSGAVLARSERESRKLLMKERSASLVRRLRKALKPLRKQWLSEDSPPNFIISEDVCGKLANTRDGVGSTPSENIFPFEHTAQYRQALRAAMDSLFRLEMVRVDTTNNGHMHDAEYSWQLQTGNVELSPAKGKFGARKAALSQREIFGGSVPTVFTNGLVLSQREGEDGKSSVEADAVADFEGDAVADFEGDVVSAYIVACYLDDEAENCELSDCCESQPGGSELDSFNFIPVTQCLQVPVQTKPPRHELRQAEIEQSGQSVLAVSPTSVVRYQSQSTPARGLTRIPRWAYFNPDTNFLSIGDAIDSECMESAVLPHTLSEAWELVRIDDIAVGEDTSESKRWQVVNFYYRPRYVECVDHPKMTTPLALTPTPAGMTNVSFARGNVPQSFLLQGAAGGMFSIPRLLSPDPSALLDNHELHGILGAGAAGTVLLAQNRLGHLHAVKLVHFQAPLPSFSSAAAIRSGIDRDLIASQPYLREAFNHMPLFHRNIIRIHDCWVEKSTDRLERAVQCLKRITNSTGLSDGDGTVASDSGSDNGTASRSDTQLTDEDKKRGGLSSPSMTCYLVLKMEWCPRTLDSFLLTRANYLKRLEQEAPSHEPAIVASARGQSVVEDGRSCLHSTSSVIMADLVSQNRTNLDMSTNTNDPAHFGEHNLTPAKMPVRTYLGTGAPQGMYSFGAKSTGSIDDKRSNLGQLEEGARSLKQSSPLSRGSGLNPQQLLRFRRHQSRLQNLTIAQHILDGLSYIHDSGLVHLDIKPANLFVIVDERQVLSAFRAREAASMVFEASNAHKSRSGDGTLGPESGALVLRSHGLQHNNERSSSAFLDDELNAPAEANVYGAMSPSVAGCVAAVSAAHFSNPVGGRIMHFHADPLESELCPMLHSLAMSDGGVPMAEEEQIPSLDASMACLSVGRAAHASAEGLHDSCLSPKSPASPVCGAPAFGLASELPSMAPIGIPPFDPIFEHSYLLTKIGDFGISSTSATHIPSVAYELPDLDESLRVSSGTFTYASPEQSMCSAGRVTGASDIYSTALVMLEMYGMETTSQGKCKLLRKAACGDGSPDSIPPFLWEAFPQEMQLICECLRADPSLRPPAKVLRKRLKAIFREISSTFTIHPL